MADDEVSNDEADDLEGAIPAPDEPDNEPDVDSAAAAPSAGALPEDDTQEDQNLTTAKPKDPNAFIDLRHKSRGPASDMISSLMRYAKETFGNSGAIPAPQSDQEDYDAEDPNAIIPKSAMQPGQRFDTELKRLGSKALHGIGSALLGGESIAPHTNQQSSFNFGDTIEKYNPNTGLDFGDSATTDAGSDEPLEDVIHRALSGSTPDKRPRGYADEWGGDELSPKIKMAAGAANPSTVAAINNKVDPPGAMPTGPRNLVGIQYAQEKGGNQAALGILQAQRREYDVSRAWADVALEHNNVASAIDAANRAYRSVPDGDGATFTQGPNGSVTAMVTDPNGAATSYNIPLHKFQQLMKNGDFDGVLDQGVADTIKQVGRRLEPKKPEMVHIDYISRGTQELKQKEKDVSDEAERRESLEKIRGQNQIGKEETKNIGYGKKSEDKLKGDIYKADQQLEGVRTRSRGLEERDRQRAITKLKEIEARTQDTIIKTRARGALGVLDQLGKGMDVGLADQQLRQHGYSIDDFLSQQAPAQSTQGKTTQGAPQGGSQSAPTGKWVYGPDGKPVWQPNR